MDDKQITYLMQKSPLYKNFHADGIFGGLTPKGQLHISFFLERSVIPQKIINELKPDSTIGKEINREGKEGVVREIECGVIMDIGTAKSMSIWLNNKIAQHEQLFPTKKIKKKGGKK